MVAVALVTQLVLNLLGICAKLGSYVGLILSRLCRYQSSSSTAPSMYLEVVVPPSSRASFPDPVSHRWQGLFWAGLLKDRSQSALGFLLRGGGSSGSVGPLGRCRRAISALLDYDVLLIRLPR